MKIEACVKNQVGKKVLKVLYWNNIIIEKQVCDPSFNSNCVLNQLILKEKMSSFER